MNHIPNIPGPKLGPFGSKESPLHIEFLELLGTGLHAHVWKVSIGGFVYALKIFTFTDEWDPSDHWNITLSEEEHDLYMHPFYNECRAYGRLKETSNEYLAVLCYGYLMIDGENKEALRGRYPESWNDDFCLDESNADKPLRCLVKEFLEKTPSFKSYGYDNHWIDVCLTQEAGKNLIGSLKTLHQAGILCRDVGGENIVNGKFLEFSCAMTVPHPCLDSAHIESSKWDDPFDGRLGYWDAYQLDELIDGWNLMHPTETIWTRAISNLEYRKRLRSYGRGRSRAKRITDLGWRPRPDKYKWKPEGVSNLPTKKRVRAQPKKKKRRRHSGKR